MKAEQKSMPIEIGFFDINQATANVLHITEMVQAKWGHDYQILSNEGLPIGDSIGTRGITILQSE